MTMSLRGGGEGEEVCCGWQVSFLSLILLLLVLGNCADSTICSTVVRLAVLVRPLSASSAARGYVEMIIRQVARSSGVERQRLKLQ